MTLLPLGIIFNCRETTIGKVMLSKSKLERFIQNYNLAGTCESVKLVSTGDTLSVTVLTDDESLLCEVIATDMEFPVGEFAIIETQKLKQLLGLLCASPDPNNYTVGMIQVEVVSSIHGTPTGIIFKDDGNSKEAVEFTLALADTSVIKQVRPFKNIPKFELTVELDLKFVTSFIKAKNALTEVDTFAIMSNGTDNLVDVIIGHSNRNTNRVKLVAPSLETFKLDTMYFSAKYLKDILNINKSGDKVKLYVSSKGLMKLVFDNNNGITSTYYIVKVDAS